MAHQMAQEGTLWPSSVIRLGPHWRNNKIKWAKQYWMLALAILNMVGAVKNTVAHP